MMVYMKAVIVLVALAVSMSCQDTGSSEDTDYISTCVTSSHLLVVFKNNTASTFTCPKEAPVCSHEVNHCVPLDVDRHPSDCPRANGVYPDPSDCSKFNLCMDGEPISFSCPEGRAFDIASKRCAEVECKNYCEGKVARMVAAASDPTLYFSSGIGTCIGVHQCQPGHVFLEDQQECGPKCPGIGKFPDARNPKKYFECFYFGGHYAPLPKFCQEGFYDTKTMECSQSARL